MTRGKLIVLEGIDGSGKSTLAAGIASAIEARGHRVVRTKEPTDGPIGQRIRELAKSGREAVSAEQEFQLFHQDRTEHVATVVRPALEAGSFVVQDRSYFSSVAYQGERGLDRARLRTMSEAIAPKPDLLFVVDLPAEVGIARIRGARAATTDGFEVVEALRRIRQVFLDLEQSDAAVVVDGARPKAEVLAAALIAIPQAWIGGHTTDPVPG